MKYIFPTYLILIHVFIGIAILKTDIISRIPAKLGYEVIEDELTPYFHTMLAFQKRVDKNLPNNSVLFVGDSITQGLAVSAVFQQSVNFGIDQDTTLGTLTRLAHYSSIPRSKLVVIAIGVNDLRRRKNDEIIENYRDIIEIIPKKIPILFSAILPVNETDSNRSGDNIRITKINKALRKICSNNHRLYFLNISKSLITPKGNLSTVYHTGDGVHLNGLGNSILISKLKVAVINITSQYEER